MNRFKLNTLSLAVLAALLITLVAGTVANAQPLVQQAAPAPALRQSPSYYNDDPSVIQGTLPAPARIVRQSPSYYMDDTSVIQSAPVPATVELRFSPSYWRDDPALVGLK